MENDNIVKGVVLYILGNRETLISRLGGKELFNAFPAADFGGRLKSQSKKVYGYAIDVVADMIKNEQFIPTWAGDEPVDVLSPHAGRIEPLPIVNHGEEEPYEQNGITRIPQFRYVNRLRTCMGFLGYVKSAKIEESLKMQKDLNLKGKWMKEEVAYLFHKPVKKS